MKNIEIPLLNDCFNHNEANDLVLQVIDKKINFYKLKNLQHQIRHEMPNPSIQYKLTQLQKARKDLLDLIDEAKQRQSDLHVEAALFVQPSSSGHTLASGTFG